MNKIQTNLLKGQVALETLLVVGLLFLFLIPLVYYVSQIFVSESWKLDTQQASAAISRIVGVVNKLSIGGEGSKATERIFIPLSAESIKVNNRTISIQINARALGTIDQIGIADVEMELDPLSNWTDVNGFIQISLNFSNGKVILSR